MLRDKALSADVWLIDLRPTARQSRSVFAVAALAAVGFAAAAPFAGRPMAALNALFPALDAIVFVTDLVTAVLLFGLYAISRSRALFALATGYLFTAFMSCRTPSPLRAPSRPPGFLAPAFRPDHGCSSSGTSGTPRGCWRTRRCERTREHGVSIRNELTDVPPIVGHRVQLQEVVLNLLQNAVEAMASVKDDSRMLTVRTRRDRDKAVVEVEDTGPGIDAKSRERVFEAFVTTKPGGMGLGLAICRTILARHGDQISASPAHPRGTVFRMILPQGRSEALRSGAGRARNAN